MTVMLVMADRMGDAVTVGGQTVNLPFPFAWYGRMVTLVGVSSNGQISMDGRVTSHCCGTVNIPAAAGNDDAIFFAKEDIDPAGVGSVVHLTQGTAPNRTWTLEFDQVPFFPGPGAPFISVQVVLYESPAGQLDIIWGPGSSGGDSR